MKEIKLRKKIAQMLIMGFDGFKVSPIVHNWVADEGIGGVILFDKNWKTGELSKNIKTQSQVCGLNEELQNCANTNLLIALDYEGGYVDRLKHVPGITPTTISPSTQAKLDETDFKNLALQMASTLKKLGFNVNFAPVVDLNLNDEEGIIGKLGRSYGSSPQEVYKKVQLFTKTHNDCGIACSYKHFPGHGSAVGDTHEGFVDVTQTYNPDELKPYEELFKAQNPLNMVMSAHVINKNLDKSGTPATLSKLIMHELLRERMGYSGVIVSDDLQMRAISEHYSLADTLELAINAEVDLLIFGNQLGDNCAVEIIDTIEKLVDDQKISEKIIDSAYARIMLLKEHIST